MAVDFKRTKKRIFAISGAFVFLFSGYLLRDLVCNAGAFFQKGALFSAAMTMPEGGYSLAKELYFAPKTDKVNSLPSEMQNEGHDIFESVEVAAPSTESPAVSSAPVTVSSDIPEKNRMPIKEEFLGHAGQNYQNVWLQNRTKNHTVDIKKELEKKVDFTIARSDKPQVLIVHTHTTEGFESQLLPHYDKASNSRSTNSDKNIVKVGKAITEALNKKGIATVQDATIHDNPSYTGSYDRSRITIQNQIKKHPSIKVVLDVHRDAITRTNGTKIKPVVTVNGKKAAQIMVVTGCDDNGTLGFPDWEHNLRFAVRLQQCTEKKYPGLARPVSFAIKKYNMNLNHGSLLIEVGSEANTMDEAIYAGQLFADTLADTFNLINSESL